MTLGWTDEFYPSEKEHIKIICINEECDNVWYIDKTNSTHNNFTCVKCGSSWRAERRQT